jgi:hypothetical protein
VVSVCIALGHKRMPSDMIKRRRCCAPYALDREEIE